MKKLAHIYDSCDKMHRVKFYMLNCSWDITSMYACLKTK